MREPTHVPRHTFLGYFAFMNHLGRPKIKRTFSPGLLSFKQSKIYNVSFGFILNPQTKRIILQEKFLPAAHEDLLAAFQVEHLKISILFDDHYRPLTLTTLVTLTRSCSPRSSLKRARLSQRWTNVFFPHRCFSSQEEMQEFCNAALDPVTKSVHYKEFVHFLSVDDNF